MDLSPLKVWDWLRIFFFIREVFEVFPAGRTATLPDYLLQPTNCQVGVVETAIAAIKLVSRIRVLVANQRVEVHDLSPLKV